MCVKVGFRYGSVRGVGGTETLSEVESRSGPQLISCGLIVLRGVDSGAWEGGGWEVGKGWEMGRLSSLVGEGRSRKVLLPFAVPFRLPLVFLPFP